MSDPQIKACVICGVRALHMQRTATFNLRSVCYDHCKCHGDGKFDTQSDWDVWTGKMKAAPMKHFDLQRGIERTEKAIVPIAAEAAITRDAQGNPTSLAIGSDWLPNAPPKKKRGRPRKLKGGEAHG